MTPTQLQSELSAITGNGIMRSVMIWGPPGVGKSAIVSQVADRHALQLVDLRLSQLAPTDLRGLPVADGKVSRWLPPEFLPNDGKGVLFLDELNMAPPAVQGIAQQLILNRRVGNYEVPQGWFIWAAGNRKEDRAAVFDMPAPLANRFLHYHVEPNFDSFRAWAGRAGIHEQVMAFLAFRPTLLHKPDGRNPAWPSCRSWELASELHAWSMGIAAAVGEGAAAEFDTFCKLYSKLPDLDAILGGRGAKIKFPDEPSLRYALIIGLSARAVTADAIRNSFGWVVEKAGAEWCQLFIHSIHDRAAGRGHTGLLATLLTSEPRMKRFLKHLMTDDAS
jgi:MoxR-like ATPase